MAKDAGAGLLPDWLVRLDPSGPDGLEGLVARLLEALTGRPMYLARSGDQQGRDVRSARGLSTVAIECKRYRETTALNETELLGKLSESAITCRPLDTWVLATTRSVSDQLASALEEAAEAHGIQVAILSGRDRGLSSLEALCAFAPRVTSAYLSKQGVSDQDIHEELERVRKSEDYNFLLNDLSERLSRIAAYERWRQRGHERLKESFGSLDRSRAEFGQPLDIGARRNANRYVPRLEAARYYEAWWNSGQEARLLAITGEEGDGKSWSVADWLLKKLEENQKFVPVLWVSARSVGDGNLEDWLAAALARELGESADLWKRRLLAWMDSDSLESPLFLLILDGLNEKHSHSRWRQELENLQGMPLWRRLQTIVTTRTQHWNYFSKLGHIKADHFEVRPFDDAELKVALSQEDLRPGDLPQGVVQLARKPRYFRLAVQHRQRLAEAGDVTVARLIYEDWRDRFESRGLALDESAFLELLKTLAKQSLDVRSAFSYREIKENIPSFSDEEMTLNELATGGILIKDGNNFRIEPRRLQLGFGLLLADLARKQFRESTDSDAAFDQLAFWLDGLPENEIKAGVAEYAFYHALVDKTFFSSQRSILLRLWLGTQNKAAPNNPRAYFPLDPEAYFIVAEQVWRGAVDDSAAQRDLMATFRHWAQSPGVRASFVRACGRWLGFLSVKGARLGGEEDRARKKQHLNDRYGGEIPLGPFTYGGRRFIGVDDDGVLRLARVALAVISTVPRTDFLEMIATKALGEALQDFPELYEEIEWVIRTSPDDLQSVLIPIATAWSQSGILPEMQAAYRLLGWLGTSHAINLREGLPEDLFPDPLATYRGDPCSAIFAWTKENVQDCAEKSTLPTVRLAQKLRPFCYDRDFNIPRNAAARLRDAWVTIDVKTLYKSMGTTEASYAHKELLIPTSRVGAALAIAKERELMRDVQNRDGLELRQLLFHLDELALLLTEAEVAAIRAVWSRFAETVDESKEERFFEAFAANLLVAGAPGGAQLDFLKSRHPQALFLASLTDWLNPLSEGELTRQLEAADDTPTLQRLLLMAASGTDGVSQRLATRVAKFVSHEDPWIRATALQTIYQSGDAGAGRMVVTSGWRTRTDSWPGERHFGSALLVEHGSQLPIAELAGRTDLGSLGAAVERRGAKNEDASFFATTINGLWQKLVAGEEPIPAGMPPTEVNLGQGEWEPARISIPPEAYSTTLSFRSPHSRWGGDDDGPARPADLFGGIKDSEIQEMNDALRVGLEHQTAIGNVWFGEEFDETGLEAVFRARPDLVQSWLKPALERSHPLNLRAQLLARSFYEAWCGVLLKCATDRGLALYRGLETDEGTRFTFGLSRLRTLDLKLFAASDSAQMRAAWRERLQKARTDLELLEITVIARLAGATAWLAEHIRFDATSDRGLIRTRALRCAGFVDADWSEELLLVAAREPEGTWAREIAEVALKDLERGRQAESYFTDVLTAETREQAWLSFQLLLETVDSRIDLFIKSAAPPVDSFRRSFLMANEDTLERAIRDNTKSLRDTLLGMTVKDNQLWPWLAADESVS